MSTKTKISNKTLKPKFSITLIISSLLVFTMVTWVMVRLFTVPSDINIIESTAKIVSSTGTEYTLNRDQTGCYYQKVQCLKEPCEPVLICPSGSKEQSDVNIPSTCTTWFDGCNTCSVRNGGIISCTKMACKTEDLKPYCKSYANDPEPMPPSPTTKPIITSLSSFNASVACGIAHFKEYQFTCSSGSNHTISENLCLGLTEAMTRAKERCQTN